jgi:putative ABC transport system permease protein
MIKDYFKLAWENISHRKVRSILTIIGIVIGIAAVVALVSLGQGVKKVITEQFAGLGTDKIFVYPAAGWSGSSGTTPLTDHDLKIVERSKGVHEAAGIIFKSARVEFNKELYITSVIGTPTDEKDKMIEESYGIKYSEGRQLANGEKYKAVIGYNLNQGKIFSKPVGLDSKIVVEGQSFDIVGIIAKTGDDTDNSIILPEDTVKELFHDEEYNYLLVRVEADQDPLDVAESIKKDLRKDRGLKEGKEDFTVQTAEELLDSFSVILSSLSAIVIGIAAISLFVGGVGIMNTMYTAVLQRTNEIGVMKAIGAKNRQILSIFLIESGMIGLIGGAIGILVGIILSKIIEFIGRTFLDTILLRAYFPWYLILGALAFAFIVGCISGLLPARQASKQNPVEALRYE